MKPKLTIEEIIELNINIDEISANAEIMLDYITSIVIKKYCIAAKKSEPSLSNEEKEKLDTLSFIILSNVKDADKITEALVDSFIYSEATPKFDRCVEGVYDSLVKKARKPLSDKKKKELRSRSFAICTSQLGPKEAKGEEKIRVIHHTHVYGKLEKDAEWDAGKEVKEATVDDLKIMATLIFGDGEQKGDYKLPHHTAADKKVVFKALAAGIAVLNGGRGGIKDLPEDARKAAYRHLASHYKEYGEDAPPLV